MPESEPDDNGNLSVARLLDPRREIVSFTGRATELERLISWCEGSSPASLRLVTGESGTGKTRLAVELAWRLAALGWVSEWAGQAGNSRSEVAGGKLLLIIDEADTRVSLAELIANYLAKAPATKILLLARTTIGWYDQLEQREPGLDGLDPDRTTSVIELSAALGVPVSRVLATAAADFGAALGLTGPTAGISDPGATAEAAATGDLQAWVLVGVLRAAGLWVPEPADLRSALASLFQVELRYWIGRARRAGITADEAQLRQALAAGCLLGAASPADAMDLARRVPGLRESAGEAALADWLHEMLPPGRDDEGWIGLARPERFAESLVTAELAASPEFAGRFLTGLSAEQTLRAIPLIARSKGPEAVLETLAADVEGLRGPAPVLMALLPALPQQPASWTRATVALAERITAERRIESDPAARAYWLTNLSRRYYLSRPLRRCGRTRQAGKRAPPRTRGGQACDLPGQAGGLARLPGPGLR